MEVNFADEEPLAGKGELKLHVARQVLEAKMNRYVPCICHGHVGHIKVLQGWFQRELPSSDAKENPQFGKHLGDQSMKDGDEVMANDFSTPSL